jgi:Flp pilus assembly protein TadG
LVWSPAFAAKACRARADTGNKVRKLMKRFRGENGQALVELAFVIPLVLLFLFGIIDFGLALNEQNQDTNVANIAARQAALGTVTSAQCAGSAYTTLGTWAICEAKATGTPVTSVCVADTSGATMSSTYAGGDPIEVEVSSTFGWLKLITGQVGNLSSNIGGNATMRLETTPSTSATSFLSPQCTS